MTTDLNKALSEALGRKYGYWDQADSLAQTFVHSMKRVLELSRGSDKILQGYFQKLEQDRQWHFFIIHETPGYHKAPLLDYVPDDDAFSEDPYLRIAFFGPSGALKIEAVNI